MNKRAKSLSGELCCSNLRILLYFNVPVQFWFPWYLSYWRWMIDFKKPNEWFVDRKSYFEDLWNIIGFYILTKSYENKCSLWSQVITEASRTSETAICPLSSENQNFQLKALYKIWFYWWIWTELQQSPAAS